MDRLVTEDQSNCWRSCDSSLSVKCPSLNIVNISLYQYQNWRTLVPIVAVYWLLVAMMYDVWAVWHLSRVTLGRAVLWQLTSPSDAASLMADYQCVMYRPAPMIQCHDNSDFPSNSTWVQLLIILIIIMRHKLLLSVLILLIHISYK